MKKVLIGLLGAVILLASVLVILVFLVPGKFEVERSIVINRPRSEVFEYVKQIKNQNEWSPWLRKDPNTKMEYTGEDGKVGFVSRWNSSDPEVGVGEQKIVKITEGESVDVELNFIEPWESKSRGFIILNSEGEDKTKLRWGFAGEMPKPMNLFLLVMDFDTEAGKEFELGLATLKDVLEKGN